MHLYLAQVLAVMGWALAHASKNTIKYSGHKIFRLLPKTLDQIDALKQLEREIKLDVWHYPHNLSDRYDVMVKPGVLGTFMETLMSNGIEYEILVNDVQRMLEKSNREGKSRKKRSLSTLYDYTRDFLSFQQIEEFLCRVKNSDTQANIDIIKLGKSSENRTLLIIKISKPSSQKKPEIFIDAGIHAREWIAPATAINFIYKLALNPQNDRSIESLLEKFDWYIMPVANPDGYQYSKDHDRFWRKTRNVNEGSECRGVDANRNFGYNWDPSIGGSRAPCDDVFSGTEPFSIPESRYLGDFLRRHGARIKAYLTMHSFGQFFLYPWGYSASQNPRDSFDLNHLAQMANGNMSRSYYVGSSGAMLYPAAGGSDDYAKGTAHIKYSYTVELPPRDNVYNSYAGFVVSRHDIAHVTEDIWYGVKAMAKELHRLLAQDDRSSGVTARIRSRSSRRSERDSSHSVCSAYPNIRSQFSSNPGLNAYIESLPEHLREWFVRYIHRYE